MPLKGRSTSWEVIVAFTMPSKKVWNAELVDTYDVVAEPYADAYFDELHRKPFDCALLGCFAASLPPKGLVADMGCGPGQIARFLKDKCGLEVSGFDLSPQMVAVARRLNPDLNFAVGDMRKLELATGTFAGIVAFYSIIHLQRAEVSDVFRELGRALQPGGLLLASFHIGRGETHAENWFGQGVSLTATFFEAEEVAGYLSGAGFLVTEVQVRPPYASELQTERGYIVAKKL